MARGLTKLIERAAPREIVEVVERAVPAPFLPTPPTPYVTGDTLEGSITTTPGETSTMGVSAAWRCQHILSDGIAALEIYAYDDSKGDVRIESPKVLADPWVALSPVEWKAMVVQSLVLYGNCYLLPWDIDPRTGYPRQLPIIHPDMVRVDRIDGRPRYRLVDSEYELDLLHIRGMTVPGGIKGMGVIEAQRKGLALAMTMDAYQSGNFRTSSVPPVVIRVNRAEISDEQAQDIQGKWVAKHGYGNRTPAVLPMSMEVTPIAWSPEDTQFLESKQYQAAEICWMFGIDPRVLGLAASGQSLTYSNIESTYVDLQRMSFTPWTSRIESSLSRVVPRTQMVRFDFAPMLRTTLQDRFMAYKTAIDGGWMTVDEVRQLENMGPIGSEPPQRHGTIGSMQSVEASQEQQSTAVAEAISESEGTS